MSALDDAPHVHADDRATWRAWLEGRLVAMEVKADAPPSSASARHLAGLPDRFDESFVAGIVFHTGPRAYRLGDRLIATPISTLWG